MKKFIKNAIFFRNWSVESNKIPSKIYLGEDQQDQGQKREGGSEI
jgi:hypothetical protein